MGRFRVAVALAATLAAPGVAVAQGDSVRGAAKAQMCVGCHEIPNYSTAFPDVYRVPKIEGQTAEYIRYALMEYAAGNRYRPDMNKLASMPAIAASLTEQDIDDLAAYYSSQGE